MIRSRKDYIDYREADRIALGRRKIGAAHWFVDLVFPDYIWRFQKLLRKLEYYGNVKRGMLSRLVYLYLQLRYRRLSVKLGFTIPRNVFGPGLAIVHYGGIVVNEKARIGANCRIHPGTNIGASAGSVEAPQIGENVYIAPGAKIFGNIRIANNTAIGANAVVNKSFEVENMLIAGVPATAIKAITIKQFIKHI